MIMWMVAYMVSNMKCLSDNFDLNSASVLAWTEIWWTKIRLDPRYISVCIKLTFTARIAESNYADDAKQRWQHKLNSIAPRCLRLRAEHSDHAVHLWTIVHLSKVKPQYFIAYYY